VDRAHTLRSQVGIGPESDCLLGQWKRILDISDSDAGVKEEKLEVFMHTRLSRAYLALARLSCVTMSRFLFASDRQYSVACQHRFYRLFGHSTCVCSVDSRRLVG